MVKLRDRLTGTPARGRARGKAWRRLLEEARRELDRLKIVPNPWWDLGPALNAQARAEQTARRNRLRSQRAEAATLAWAINHGEPADGEWPLIAPNPRSPASLLRMHCSDPVRPRATVEDHPFIDLATIRKRGWLDGGKIVRWHLAWSPKLTDGMQLLLIVDLTRRGKPQLRMQFFEGGLVRPVCQTLELVERPAMPGRLFLKCPALGTMHERLYLRDGFFASAQAQRLDYRSRVS